MIESKGWDWENVDSSLWLEPVDDCVYLAYKWKKQNYKDILDLGTGLGRHAIYFSKQGFNVSAIDISEYGVKHLESWAKSEGLTIDTKVCDMLSLPYPDNSFDCIFACHVISHCDTAGIKKIISEIERVLKPNGEVFLTFSSKESTEFIEIADQIQIDENTIIRNAEPETGIPHFFVNLRDVVDLLCNFNIQNLRHIEYCDPDLINKKRSFYYYVNASVNKECFQSDSPMPSALHDSAMQYYRQYLVVGGMPECVMQFAETGDYILIREIQSSILVNYLVSQVYKARLPRKPLDDNKDIDAFKIYVSDLGLLCAKKELVAQDVLYSLDKLEYFKGAMAENYVNTHLTINGYTTYYWESDRGAEVDFIIQRDGAIIPIEVKSADNVQAKSLKIYIDNYKPKYAIKLSAKNFGFVDGKKIVPLYAVFCI